MNSDETFTFNCSRDEPDRETVTMSLRGTITARQLRYAFGRFMLAAGYVPETVNEVLGEWTDCE